MHAMLGFFERQIGLGTADYTKVVSHTRYAIQKWPHHHHTGVLCLYEVVGQTE